MGAWVSLSFLKHYYLEVAVVGAPADQHSKLDSTYSLHLSTKQEHRDPEDETQRNCFRVVKQVRPVFGENILRKELVLVTFSLMDSISASSSGRNRIYATVSD